MVVTKGPPVYWTDLEKQQIIETAFELFQEDEAGPKKLTIRKALKAAMEQALPESRWRPLQTLGAQAIDWFIKGLSKRNRQESKAAARAAATGLPAAPATLPATPGAPPPPRRLPGTPSTPYDQRIRWSRDEKAALIQEGVRILSQGNWPKQPKLRKVLEQAMVNVLPEERRRSLKGTSFVAATFDWFRDGVAAGLSAVKDAVAALDAAASDDAELVELEPEINPELVELGPDPAPGPHASMEFRYETPAWSPARDAPVPDAPPVLPGLDLPTIVGLLVSRLVADRDAKDAKFLALVANVEAITERLERVSHQLQSMGSLLERLKPLEANAGLGHQLLRAVVQSLDPALLTAFDAGPASLSPAARSALPAPPTNEPYPIMPKLKICLLGVKPAEEPRISKKVNGYATLESVWDSAKQKSHDYRPYDRVIATRFASHAAVHKAEDHVGKEKLIRVPNGGLESVASTVLNTCKKFEFEWQQAHRN